MFPGTPGRAAHGTVPVKCRQAVFHTPFSHD